MEHIVFFEKLKPKGRFSVLMFFEVILTMWSSKYNLKKKKKLLLKQSELTEFEVSAHW